MDKLKLTSQQLKNPCDGCKVKDKISACCQYITIPTPTQEDHEGDEVIDHDTIYWFLTRPGIMVTGTYQEDGEIYEDPEDWEVQFETPCRHLASDGRCGIYNDRPAICSDHQAFATIQTQDDENEDLPSHCERYYNDDNIKEVIFTDTQSFLEFTGKEFNWHPNIERDTQKFDMTQIEITDETKPEQPKA